VNPKTAAKLHEMAKEAAGIDQEYEFVQWSARVKAYLTFALGVGDATAFEILPLIDNPSWPEKLAVRRGHLEALAERGDVPTTTWKLPSITAAAATLSELRSLPVPKQTQLLLRRLATQYGDSRVSFGKMNFALLPHATDLAQGFPPHEIMAVKELLLGAPWKRLELDGFIQDDGRGFFHVTPEGYEAAQNADTEFIQSEIIAAILLLHPDFQNYGHYFREEKLKEAVAAAFEHYENRLNQIRDTCGNSAVKGAAGPGLIYKLFSEKVLHQPYPQLGNTASSKAAYEQGFTGILSGSLSWIRNAYTHEKHNIPDITPQEALELLFVASYLMRMLDLAAALPRAVRSGKPYRPGL
jgi:hypothetical protein